MDPDILCPAQVIPVGFKGTAGAGPVRTTRLLPVASAIKTPGPGLVVRRDKVNLRGTFVTVACCTVVPRIGVCLPSRYVGPDIAITRRDWFLPRSLVDLYHYVQTRNFATPKLSRQALKVSFPLLFPPSPRKLPSRRSDNRSREVSSKRYIRYIVNSSG